MLTRHASNTLHEYLKCVYCMCTVCMFMCVYMPHVCVVCNVCLCIYAQTHIHGATEHIIHAYTYTQANTKEFKWLQEKDCRTFNSPRYPLILLLFPQVASFHLNIWVSQSSVNKASCSRKQGIIGCPTHTHNTYPLQKVLNVITWNHLWIPTI